MYVKFHSDAALCEGISVFLHSFNSQANKPSDKHPTGHRGGNLFENPLRIRALICVQTKNCLIFVKGHPMVDIESN